MIDADDRGPPAQTALLRLWGCPLGVENDAAEPNQTSTSTPKCPGWTGRKPPRRPQHLIGAGRRVVLTISSIEVTVDGDAGAGGVADYLLARTDAGRHAVSGEQVRRPEDPHGRARRGAHR